MRTGFLDGIDALVPVPLAPVRLRQRGYNQSEVLAQGISEVSGLPVLTHVARRTTFSKSQTRLTTEQRFENPAEIADHTLYRVDRQSGLLSLAGK